MDAEILKTFLEEAKSYLPRIRGGIIAYEQDETQMAELQASRRLAHTIKGSAKMLNLSEIWETALEIESRIKIIVQTKTALTEEKSSELLSKILVLESDLNELQTLLSAAAPGTAGASEENSGQVFQIPDSIKEISLESVIEEFELDAEMLEIFALEAEDHLRKINANLEILSSAPNSRKALLEVRRSAHTLKGSAAIVGFKRLSALAHRVEDLLDYLAENEIESSARILEILQASTDCLSALAGGENSPRLKEKIERLYQSFDDVFASFKSEKVSSALAVVEENQEETAIDAAAVQSKAACGDASNSETKENPSFETLAANRTVIRVSVERIKDLFNLVGEMVISRAVFEQRLREFEQQIEELHRATGRLRSSTAKLETDFQISSQIAQNSTFNGGGPLPGSSSIFQSSPNNFDALEFDHYTEFHQTTLELAEAASDAFAINFGLDHLLDNLNLLFDSQRRLIEGMQDNLLHLRMISLGSLAPRLQRTVRMTAEEEGKLVELVVENESLEIETELLDSFVEPLLHLLRNAVAHGIEKPEKRRRAGKPEKGKITLRAYNEGTHIVFVIADDGGGISVPALKEKAFQAGFISKKEAEILSDEAAYSLIFLPGLSTAPEINQVSGRGIGMNVVNASVTRCQGTISIKSQIGKGASFIVRLPMSLATTRALLVKSGTQAFAFPLNLVKQITEISGEKLEKARRKKSLTYEGICYTFRHFNELLNGPSAPDAKSSKTSLILLKTLESPCALAVEQILKNEEIVIKPLDAVLKNIPEITGAALLGDGSVVPVLDLIYLLKKEREKEQKIEREKGRRGEREKNAKALSAPHAEPRGPLLIKVLIVDDSPTVRQINSRVLKNAGWQVSAVRDGLEALEVLQTGGILPDVILTDVEMPRMNGYELLAWLKQDSALSKIPVVMITSRAGDKHRRKAFDMGASAYLVKPYEDAELLEKIRILTKVS